MTIAMDRPDLPTVPTTQDTQRVSWSKPARWLWVAETPSEYLGMVDRNYDGYVATGFDGRDLGVFSVRADAQVAVYSHWFRAVEGD
jgi:hypothetical protein